MNQRRAEPQKDRQRDELFPPQVQPPHAGPVYGYYGDVHTLDMEILDWLLDSDPAIRWQTMRDLTDASPAEVAAFRARVPREGLGANILACQETNGSWRRAGEPAWLSTLFTLLLLRATGVDPAESAIESANGASRGRLALER